MALRTAPALAVLLPPLALASPDYDKVVRPLLETYCYDCHGDGTAKGDVSLDQYGSMRELLDDSTTWGRSRHNVAQHIMPPPDKDQPTARERDLILQWIDEQVFHVDCDHPKPGRVTLRRLNRTEYENTVRDWLGVDFVAGDRFPPDDAGYGFDNIGDVLSLSPLLLEKYADAAEEIAGLVAPGGGTEVREARNMTGGSPGRDYRGSYSVGSWIYCKFEVRVAGDHTLRVLAHGDRGGGEWPLLQAQLNNRDVGQRRVEARSDKPIWVEYKLAGLRPGKQTIRMQLAEDYYRRDGPREDRDRNVYVHRAELVAPEGDGPDWMACEGDDPMACARRALPGLMRRAFRRPATASELDRQVDFVRVQIEAGESYPDAMRLALQTLLVSPKFLFRGGEPEAGPVDEFALASRLSYFLWSSGPDEELLDLAQQGQLRRRLDEQLGRMLRDRRAESLERNFLGQWLQLRNLDLVNPDRKRYPEFDDKLRGSMRRETELLFRHVREHNRPLHELVTADYTYLDARLAKHYGISGFQGEGFRHIRIHDGKRGGVLTHAGVLTLTSYPTRTSPVVRGNWVLDALLGMPPPPPPPNVPELPDDEQARRSESLRDRLEAHRKDPVCASCHQRIDPVGFGLEHFDAVGKWRDRDPEGREIDANGRIAGRLKFNGHAGMRALFAEELADPFVRCVAEKMLTYALGRGLDHQDVCAVDEICRELAADGNRFQTLVRAIAHSVPFQQQDAASVTGP